MPFCPRAARIGLAGSAVGCDPISRTFGVTLTLTLIVGLLLNAIILPFAVRRVLFLYRLISHGQPAPERMENVT